MFQSGSSQALRSFLQTCKADPEQFTGFIGTGATDIPSKTNPSISVSFCRENAGSAVVAIREPYLPNLKVHFFDGRATAVELGNPGRSGWNYYKAEPDVVAKISGAAASFSSDPNRAGDLVLFLAGQFGLQNINSRDSRGDEYSTSQRAGAHRAMALIHEKLIDRRLFISNHVARETGPQIDGRLHERVIANGRGTRVPVLAM